MEIWVCHDFLLVFLYKIYREKKEGDVFFSSSGEWVAYNIVVWIYIGVLVVQREGGVGGLFGTIWPHSVYSIYPHAS